ncbi:bifunctional helix-turn-helix transcriptional regulator/GNAT family N-acetyltransferase [Ottowia thiooxydans]|uniref:bifunctional helix-turn-helix transcriptional regulator/GNAT family N-acetyltransferase n=1 Tax=Ottowia thiooxydans TaxID=219182 RepID=UPI0004105F0E|nr:helix-turn-helix domain-containing GNAT family N-acetyltransferase [Ottowia thiooxydans]
MTTNIAEIDSIRAASRMMVRELGFMNPTLASTGYSASAVHALLEIDAREDMTSAQLVQLLGLEKSSVSRMLAKLVAAGELREEAVSNDGRIKLLRLTEKGRTTVAQIHAFGQLQVRNAFGNLNRSQQQAVAQGLAAYAGALKAHRLGSAEQEQSLITITTGYRSGLVGRIAEMHAAFYSTHFGFGQFFESKVASGVAEFAGRLHEPCNRVWTALLNGRIVGSLAIDGQDLGDNKAHLRWFVLDDGCRGSGVGRILMAEAMAFCDIRGFSETHLWTFKGLDAARKLYESFGFRLMNEEQGAQWGSTVTEQQFARVHRPA